MKILQIVEESPSLDFTIPIFDQIHEENEIIIFTIRPTYNYWFDHKPEKLFPENNTNVIVTGPDKELVGKVASEIKMLKPVEPYKAKGIKEKGQYVLRKEGKKK